MKTLLSIIEELKPFQQQAVIDILATIQEDKLISRRQVGLIACNFDSFPIEEIKTLFIKNPILKIAVNKILAKYGYLENGFVNLSEFVNTIIENEINRRIFEQNQKDLYDLADGE